MLYRTGILCITLCFLTQHAYTLYLYTIDPQQSITLVSYDNAAYIMPIAALKHSNMLRNALYNQEKLPQLISPLHYKIIDCTPIDTEEKRNTWQGNIVMRSAVYSPIISLSDFYEGELSKLCALLMTLEGMHNRSITPVEQIEIIAHNIASQRALFLTSLGLAGVCDIPLLDNALQSLVKKSVEQYGIRMLDSPIACIQSIISQKLEGKDVNHFEASGLRHFEQFLALQKSVAKKDCMRGTNKSELAPYVQELTLQDFMNEQLITIHEHPERSHMLIGATTTPFKGRNVTLTIDGTHLCKKRIHIAGLELIKESHTLGSLCVGQLMQHAAPPTITLGPLPFTFLHNLCTLELVEQPHLDLKSTIPAPLDSIKVLALLKNKQVMVSANALLNLPHLRRLYIEGTEKLTLTDNMCMPNTELIAITNNTSLQLLPEVRWIAPHLIVLNLSNNNLQSLPRHLASDLTSLRTLILNNNQLRSFDEATLGNLPSQLHIIELEHNALTKVATSACKKLTALEHLLLKGNPLSEEEIKRIKKRLRHVQITIE